MLKKWLLFLSVFILTVACITACDLSIFSPNGNSDSYILIYANSERFDEGIDSAINGISDAILTSKGAEAAVQSHLTESNDGACEIILGNTNRQLSTEAAANIPGELPTGIHIFSVLIKNGDVAICGSSSDAVGLGAAWFIKNHIEDIPESLETVMFTTVGEYNTLGISAACYELSRLDSIASVNTVEIGGILFEEFAPATLSYDIALGVRDDIPKLSVTVPGAVKTEIIQASEDTASAKVTVTSGDGSNSKTYTFNFERNDYDVMKNAEIEKVYGGKDAIVVIVHDDGTHDTVDYMVDEFSEHGLVGTLGLITKNLASKNSSGKWVLKDAEVKYWKNILKSGVFDVASHSHTHSFWGLTDEDESGWYLDSGGNLKQYSVEAGRITEEVAGSQEILRMAFPDQDVLAFIKPGFGRVSDPNGTTGLTQISEKAYEIIGNYYIGMRNTGGGVETIPAADVYSIKSHTVKAEETSSNWQAEVNSAIRENGMIVFLFHKIEDDPTGLTANMDETDVFFEWLGEKSSGGTVWNVHLEDAIRYTEECKNSDLDMRDYGDRIEVSLTHEMDNEIFNHELTVRIPIPTSAETVTAELSDGTAEEIEVLRDGNGYYVLINIVPNSGTITLNI